MHQSELDGGMARYDAATCHCFRQHNVVDPFRCDLRSFDCCSDGRPRQYLRRRIREGSLSSGSNGSAHCTNNYN
jgi:hypothetical protein